MREVEKAANEKNNARAKLALEMFCYRIKKYIGSYAAAMGGVDAVVFTGGIGENSASMRAGICKGLDFLGLDFDSKKNETARGEECLITTATSKVKAVVIPTNEELVIALDTVEIMKKQALLTYEVERPEPVKN